MASGPANRLSMKTGTATHGCTPELHGTRKLRGFVPPHDGGTGRRYHGVGVAAALRSASSASTCQAAWQRKCCASERRLSLLGREAHTGTPRARRRCRRGNIERFWRGCARSHWWASSLQVGAPLGCPLVQAPAAYRIPVAASATRPCSGAARRIDSNYTPSDLGQDAPRPRDLGHR